MHPSKQLVVFLNGWLCPFRRFCRHETDTQELQTAHLHQQSCISYLSGYRAHPKVTTRLLLRACTEKSPATANTLSGSLCVSRWFCRHQLCWMYPHAGIHQPNRRLAFPIDVDVKQLHQSSGKRKCSSWRLSQATASEKGKKRFARPFFCRAPIDRSRSALLPDARPRGRG